MHASIRDMFVRPAISIFVAVTAVAFSDPAHAHNAPSGWAYPYACCSGIDCREVSSTSIAQRQDGYVIKKTGEVVGYKDKRLRRSPDGLYHWCSIAGLDTTRTICLFVPPQLF